MFALQLLGPVQLQRDGEPLPLRTHKSLALLLLLALDGPRHRSALAAWLWPGLGESDGRRNLRRELARLREAGAADALANDGEVLALAGNVQCDARQLDAELHAGRPDAALALWHGPPADGLQVDAAAPFDDWLAALRLRLLAQRRRALQASAAALEAAGDAEGALRRIEQLLADDPLQEAQHRDAMRLQLACGRREAALAQYERCRALLSAELGLVPMAETTALASGIRAALQPAPEGAAAGAAMPVPASATAAAPAWRQQMPLAGREAELARLEAAWCSGDSLLIEGQAGIGKTRLATDFAASKGAFALAQCRPGDREVPYASFTRALRRLAGDSLGEAGLAAWVTGELSRILPELGPASGAIASAEDRRRFFEACAAAWAALSTGNFDAVVIDDWHLADASSRVLFGFIAQQRAESASPGARMVFVFRPELDDTAREALAALADGSSAAPVQLGPLDTAQMLALVRGLSGAADPQRFAARLERATGGNPFFVAETLRHWFELRLLTVDDDGRWRTPFDDATAAYGELPLPDSVRDAVLLRVRRLPEAARRLLEAAALAAEPFAPALLAGACALSEVEALAAIADAVSANVLCERTPETPARGQPASRPDGYAFVHDLVQLALDSALAPERRRLVHRRLALGAQAAALAPTEVARHWEAGGEPQRAVEHRMAAANAALALYSDADAEAQWSAAWADQPTLAQRARILSQRWALLRNRDDRPGLVAAVAEFDELRRLALAGVVDASDATEVALDAGIEAAHILSLIGGSAEALQRIDTCLAAPIADVARRAHALMVRTQALNGVGRSEEAGQAAELALAGGGLSAMQQGQLMHALIYSHFLRDQPRPALAYARRTLQLWQSIGARRSVARAHANIGLLLGMLDEQQAACESLERAYAIATELRVVELQREVANNLAYHHLHLGAPARAITVVREAWDLSPHFSQLNTPVFFLGMLVQANYQQGALGAALVHAEDAFARALVLNQVKTLADCVSMALDLYTFIGDHEGAARLIASLEGRSLEGFSHFRIKLAFNLAFHALSRGDLTAAHQHLATVGEVPALSQPPDQANARLRHAQLTLAEGDARGALHWLAPLCDTDLHVETRALVIATRLAALAALGEADAGVLAQADAALASGVLPALAALSLRRERANAATRAGDVDGAARLHAEIGSERRRLADSLHDHPRQRDSFLALWA